MLALTLALTLFVQDPPPGWLECREARSVVAELEVIARDVRLEAVTLGVASVAMPEEAARSGVRPGSRLMFMQEGMVDRADAATLNAMRLDQLLARMARARDAVCASVAA